MSQILSASGNTSDAITSCNEATHLFSHPNMLEGHAPDVALHLLHGATLLSKIGQQHEAICACTKAVEIQTTLSNDNPAVFEPQLVMGLDALAYHLARDEKYNDALNAARKAVVIYRKLTRQTPAAFAPAMENCLTNMATYLAKLGSHQEARLVAQEAEDILRTSGVGNLRGPRARTQVVSSFYQPPASNDAAAKAKAEDVLRRQEEARKAARKQPKASLESGEG